jgi:hypothetical protein
MCLSLKAGTLFLEVVTHNMNSDLLLYRRQFILGDRPVPDMPEWKSLTFGPFHLKVHPDLETTLARGSKAEFLMLGFALGHLDPAANNQKLMDKMARACHNIEEMLEYIRDLCGRYVVLFNFSGKTGLLNDLIGSRSVYWCIHQNAVWSASQPGMLSSLLGIDEDLSSTVQAYMEKDMFVSGEGCWIGDGTKYVGVRHLLPNHYLDLNEKRSIRYWPTCTPQTLDVETASRKGASILENTMLAATNRFQLSMAVTAGWDSRCLLAATSNVRSRVYYYIQKYGGMTDSHPDIRIPRRLAQKLSIPFRVIECSDYQDAAFDLILERNVFVLHNPAKKVLYRSFYQGFQGKVNASGNISDLCRTFFGINPVHDIVDLLAPVRLSNSEYAVSSLKTWYSEANSRCQSFGYNLRDLFFWEQVLANWGSMFAAELDIAIDEFYPFGTRRLVETILAVDERLRPYSNSSVHRRMIELLWPELLSEPINPIGERSRVVRLFHQAGKHTLARLGLLSHIKSLHSRMRGS